MNLNKVFLIGRLTQNPEIRTTANGQMVSSFSIATNRIWVDSNTKERQERTEYHNIVLWRKLAEIASQYLTKGSLVLIEGKIQTRSWQDQNGNKRYKTEIIADNIQLGPKLSSQTPSQNREIKEIKADFASSKSEEEIPVIEDKEEEIDVENIPF
ncbi:MAG: single-stranded DNA-binding protein [Candidatus Pacebacteria bacterium]|nr:single-stranded DNA-binding protein [Candidatus Paceibacterota bacterium]